jgi:hypothetical protein
MKINEISKFYPIEKAGSDPIKRANSKEEGDFDRVLGHELDSGSSIRSQACSVQIGIEQLSRPPFLQNTSVSESESMMADSVDSTLVQFERIEERLCRGDATPRAIDRSISSLLDSAGSLAEELKALPEEHPLRQIGNELNILAHVESLKWQRGEYL